MGKTIFVSGGSRGIGKGIVTAFAASGYDVAFTYYSQQSEAEILKESLAEKYKVRIFIRQAALQEDGVAESVMEWSADVLGHLDIVVCNAGMTIHTNFLEMKKEEADYSFSLNFLSYLICAKEAARHMKERKIKGRIIMITSTRGLCTYPEDPLYGGMKAALHRACESLALEFSGDGITVNCIAPGNTAVRGNYTREELTALRFQRKIPAGRAGTPNEVAELVKLLASDDGEYITGSIFKIDGGLILPVMPLDFSEDAGPGWHELPQHIR